MLIDQQANASKLIKRFKGKIVHVTHTDLDAVCSDAILRRKHGDILTIYSSVQDFESNINHLAASDRRSLDLYLSDLGGHLRAVDTLAQLKSNGWHIEWRDHHIWSEETMRYAKHVVNYLRVDPQFCACEIVYQDLLPHDLVAHEIAIVGRDRDFWINDDPRSEMLSTVIHNDVWRRQVAKNLCRGIFSNSSTKREYKRQKQKKKKTIRRAIQHSRTQGKTVVTVSKHYASDIAAVLREKYGSTIEIVIRPNGVFSIRSTDPISNAIAEVFGGGGHPHAAGGNLHFSTVDRILFRLYTFRLKKVQELIRTASTYDKSQNID